MSEPADTDPPPLLPPPLLAMMVRGVSVIVASCGASRMPSVMRAVGSWVRAGGRDITVYLARSQSRQLLDDIQATGQVAVVFSQPDSHRTVQLKSANASLRPLTDADLPALLRYRESMEAEVGAVGFEPAFVHAMLAHRIDDLVAVWFTPEQAFDQSPGPQAGAALLPAAPLP